MRTNSIFLPLLLAVAVGCGRPSSDVPVIASSNEYGDILKEAESISKPLFEKYDQGEALDEQEKADLGKAAKLFEGLSGYNDKIYTLYFAMGKCYQILGDDKLALNRFEQAIRIMLNVKDETARSTMAETRYLASISLERERAIDIAMREIDEALKIFPDNPNYLTQRAALHIQKNEFKEAQAILERALKLDATHRRAQMLSKYVKSASK